MTLHAALSRNFDHSLLRNIIIVAAASLLITLSAKVSIPFYPVPMTMQTFVVIGLGLALGPRLGLAAVAFYLAQGALGLPVFTGTPEKGIGWAYMMGPTGGYLLGFLIAVYVSGMLAERGWDRNIFTAFAVAVIGTAILMLPGVLWLGVLFGWDKPILEWGLYPFILGGFAKAALAAAVFPAAWRFLKARGLG
ncbi:biotin transporter BioY [Denitrobaculum tricleocarpae]|uniref:Biotin transporter n=1 Tax=Denitrobaculum tricleocarpae TaxID=2591009 RepID=A0A545T0B2_9PROT|nr:biotin transporter BioY [Denitrobaculum tricleocarpae]TQV70640.1 biotin transporter BioY [Denitrobaculum tricleocarpae]